MSGKTAIVVAVVLSALILAAPSSADTSRGTLKGKIVDHQGFPLSGVCVYLSSPSILGVKTYITGYSGQYSYFDLPHGTYKMMVEMTGFKTIVVEGVRLGAGETIITDFKMASSALDEEKVSRLPEAAIDRGSARLTTVVDRDILDHIPMPRNFTDILALVPGFVFADNAVPSTQASAHGAPETANTYLDDGVNITDPVNGTSLSRINVDLIDQVVVETAAVPVDRGPGHGAYIQVIRKAGGKESQGSLTFAATGWYLTKSLWAGREPADSAVTAPVTEKTNLDLSFAQGGTVMEDTAWYFTSLRFKGSTESGPFSMWTDPDGGYHYPYDWNDVYKSANLKGTVRIASRFEGTLDFEFSSGHRSYYEPDMDWYRTGEATRRLAEQPGFLMRAQLLYTKSQKTVFDLSLGYAVRNQSILLNSMASEQPRYIDTITGYSWGSGVYNGQEKRSRFDARGSVTRLLDEALGASHQFKAGLDYESQKAESSDWKSDDLIMYYADGSPYTYGQAVSPVSGETVGTGRIAFSVIPASESGFVTRRDLSKIGLFAQDTLNFGRRAVLSLGLRFDSSDAQFGTIIKSSVGNDVAKDVIGEEIVMPVVGYNPFSSMGFGQWENVITWNTLSPRLGLTFDLFGTGRTILKGSYSRLPENLGLGYSVDLDPVPASRVHSFVWYDENGDGLVDEDDSFTMLSENYGAYETEIYQSRVDPKLPATFIDEWTAGIEHELSRDFSLAARFISRTQKGVIADVMYDPESGTPWYTADAGDGWWVPFTTTVPGAGDFGDSAVTVYFRSNDAPEVSDRIQKVSELGRKYRGLELSFRKRMSHNWQLYGSLVWSRSTGAALDSQLSAGISTSILTPNSFVNVGSGSRTSYDRPLAFRLMGTVRFKYDILLSAFYRYMSGAPWARTVSIVAPADWAAENNVDASTPVTVYLESPGTRRYPAWQRTDFRLEKEIVRNGRLRWSIALDVMNAFGNKYKIIDGNDGYWYPDGAGTTSGTHTLSSTYGKAISLSGTRSFVLNIRLGF